MNYISITLLFWDTKEALVNRKTFYVLGLENDTIKDIHSYPTEYINITQFQSKESFWWEEKEIDKMTSHFIMKHNCVRIAKKLPQKFSLEGGVAI